MTTLRRILWPLALAAVAVVDGLAQSAPVDLTVDSKTPLRFVAYGDTRFTNPADTVNARPEIRQTLVAAIADAKPAFISIGGDIVNNGSVAGDWADYDSETAVWRLRKIRVFPALGNHDLKGDQQTCLNKYFQRYPELARSRYYSVRAGNLLLLTLDSSLDEISGPQGEWLKSKLDHAGEDVDFIAIVMHHPPYTSSSDAEKYGGGHSARAGEEALGHYLEARQPSMHARLVVFAGHVHNYERHEHGGVTYFVTGGGGAHAYPIERGPSDPFQSNAINFHYLLAEVDHNRLNVTMNRVEMKDGKPEWSQPDRVTITAPERKRSATAAGGRN